MISYVMNLAVVGVDTDRAKQDCSEASQRGIRIVRLSFLSEVLHPSFRCVCIVRSPDFACFKEA